jgi:hypothetical protein
MGIMAQSAPGDRVPEKVLPFEPIADSVAGMQKFSALPPSQRPRSMPDFARCA